jgi:hypothetical protein
MVLQIVKYFSFVILFPLLISCAVKPIVKEKQINTNSITKIGESHKIIISKIISDSRCPEGLTCIWAGEVELVLLIYKEDVFYKEIPLTINFKNFPENKLLLEKYTSNKRIRSIEVFPIKKQGVAISLKDYLLKIDYVNN